MARVTLYTRDGCPHCARTREAILGTGDRLVEVNLSHEPQAMTEFLKLTGGRRVVPVVVRGGRIEVAPDGGTEF
ncbi:MAG: glutaredoxin [Deltaproteobacteria bacterium]|nr:glutaredoxin [Deltaproteobacteria bacterium]